MMLGNLVISWACHLGHESFPGWLGGIPSIPVIGYRNPKIMGMYDHYAVMPNGTHHYSSELSPRNSSSPRLRSPWLLNRTSVCHAEPDCGIEWRTSYSTVWTYVISSYISLCNMKPNMPTWSNMYVCLAGCLSVRLTAWLSAWLADWPSACMCILILSVDVFAFVEELVGWMWNVKMNNRILGLPHRGGQQQAARILLHRGLLHCENGGRPITTPE